MPIRGAFPVAALMILMSVNSAFSKTRIDVYWTTISLEIAPQQARHESSAHSIYTIDGNIVVSGNASGALGSIINGENGSPGGVYTERVTLKGSNIVVQRRFAGFTVFERINTAGATGCSAAVSYSRIHGSANFIASRKSNGEQMTIAKFDSKDARCTVTQE